MLSIHEAINSRWSISIVINFLVVMVQVLSLRAITVAIISINNIPLILERSVVPNLLFLDAVCLLKLPEFYIFVTINFDSYFLMACLLTFLASLMWGDADSTYNPLSSIPLPLSLMRNNPRKFHGLYRWCSSLIQRFICLTIPILLELSLSLAQSCNKTGVHNSKMSKPYVRHFNQVVEREGST